jgi:uncharacterized protein (DUF1330 family)
MHQMQITNEVVPSDPAQLALFGQPGPDGPIFMVNLLKFRERAEYEDGRETDLTGRAAYELYGAGVVRLVAERGGRVVFAGDVSALMLGQADDLWDQVAVVEYPNRAALVAMAASDEYQEIAVHRVAGLAGQLNIETTGIFVPHLAGSSPC